MLLLLLVLGGETLDGFQLANTNMDFLLESPRVTEEDAVADEEVVDLVGDGEDGWEEPIIPAFLSWLA